tara:strand:+ start:7245 stop:8603 length:1359 start_codon:yes stop_codon:yes gene_type:complete
MFHLIAAFFYKVSGIFGRNIAEFSVNLVSPLFGSLTLIYAFLFTRKLYNSRIAFFATIFVAFIPLHIYMSAIPYQDAAVCFFVLASVYYLFEKKAFVSGIFAGLSLSTKYTAVFVVPLLLFLAFLRFGKNKKELVRILLLLLIATSIFGLWWYARNYVVLGNPVWPFLDSVIGQDKGIDPNFFHFTEANVELKNLLKPDFLWRIYLSMYGVPGAGNAQNLTFLKLPFLNVLLGLWFLGTFIFTVPFIFYLIGIKLKDKRNWMLIVWFLSFFSFAIFNKVMNDLVYIRHSMPLFIPLGIMWAIGLNKLVSNKKGLFRLAVFMLIGLCIIGFSAVELVKAVVVSRTWGSYEEDFNWLENNTAKDAVILVPRGDCYAYNFNRYTYSFYGRPYIDSVDKIKEYNISYIWVNQKIDFYGPDEKGFSAAYPDDFMDIIRGYSLVYSNNKTSTEVYRVD